MTTSQPIASIAKWFVTLWMLAVVAATFLWVPSHEGLGTTGRIIMLHVPTAWLTTFAFAISAWYSALYLWRRRLQHDDHALAAVELGFLFSILATVSGSIFAKVVWGSFWNWDPRETSILVLLLIYGAYFALRSAIDDAERRRQLAAVYALFAFVTVPLLIFVVPRLYETSLHPNCAFIQGSRCEGITLSEGRVGSLGDQVFQVENVQQEGDVVTASVNVRGTGGVQGTTLQPSLNLTTGERVTPNFPESRWMLALEHFDGNNVRLNIQPPGNESQLGNVATRTTLFASLFGFTGLFFWLYSIRSMLLGLQRRAEAQGIS
jgi:heme exporter protein C